MHRVWLFVLLLLLASVGTAPAEVPTSPHLKPDGSKWRVGYLEGGHYNDYVPVTKATIAHLRELGWLKETDPRCLQNAQTSQAIWGCLQTSVQSAYVTFVPDAFWSADWDEQRRVANRNAFYARAEGKGDIDLMLALGTWAGQDLAVHGHRVPTVVCSTSNAVASGIIKSPEDSGFDHVHARVDPTRYARQVRLFHDIVHFKRLGIVYEDSMEGRTYAGIEQIEPVARERGFELVVCHAPFGGVSLEEADAAVAACHAELAPKVDAMYITIHRGVNPANMERLLAPFFRYRIPTFAMGTLFEVRRGALMSMAQPNFDYAGKFYAETAARIMNGASPRDLSQLLPDPQDISINLETAKRIGFHFPLEVIGGARNIYEHIETHQEK